MKRGRPEALHSHENDDNALSSSTTTQSSLLMHHYHHDILVRAVNFSELFCEQKETLPESLVPNSNSNSQSFRNILHHPTNNYFSMTQGTAFLKEQSICDDAVSSETAPTVATNDDVEQIVICKRASVGTIENEIPGSDPMATLDFSNSLVARALQTDTLESPPRSPLIHCASTISSLPSDVIPVYCTPPPLERRNEASLTAAATQESIQQAAFAERTADEMAHVVQWWYHTATNTANSSNGTATMDALSAPWNTPLRAKGTTSSLESSTIDSLDQSQSLPCNSLLWDDVDVPNDQGDEHSVVYSKDSNSMVSMSNDPPFGAALSCAALPSAEILASFDKCIAELWHVTNDAASARYRVDAAATGDRSGNDTVVTMASGASKSHGSNHSGTWTRLKVPPDDLFDDVPIRARRDPVSKQSSVCLASLEELLTLSSTSSAGNVQGGQPPRRSSHAVDLSSQGEHADTNKRLLRQENYALRRRLQSMEGIIAVLCLIVLLLAWQLATVPRPASLPTSHSTTTSRSKVDTIIDYTRLSQELRKVLAESSSTAQCDRPLAE
jgi:hypothetical protein